MQISIFLVFKALFLLDVKMVTKFFSIRKNIASILICQKQFCILNMLFGIIYIYFQSGCGRVSLSL